VILRCPLWAPAGRVGPMHAKRASVVPLLFLALAWRCATKAAANGTPAVTVKEERGQVILQNGLISLTVSTASGDITAIESLDQRHRQLLTDRKEGMYLDANGGPDDAPENTTAKRPKAGYDRPLFKCTCRLVQSGPDDADVELKAGPGDWFPFHTEVHYVLQRGQSGFHAYVMYSHLAGMPAGGIGQTRFAIKGAGDLFTNHVVDDKRMGLFDASPVVQTVQDTTYRLADGTIYTKYDNSAFTCDYVAHGLAGHGTGLWVVWPSTEFLNGGPLRQDLTVHAGNMLLAMFQGGHFGAGGIAVKEGEVWSKLFGPVFIYVNHGPSVEAMWADAKACAARERAQWPYAWLKNEEYPLQRATVSGQMELVGGGSTKDAWVVLAPPDGKDWPLSTNGYMFYSKTDAEGRFSIPKVRPGNYTLFVSGANQFEDFRKENVIVGPQSATDLGVLQWTPITHGRTLWQIGVADRSSSEFKGGDDVRHYGNFLRYPTDFPDDVTFTIGKSHENTDWNFAQWTWYSKKPYWSILFDLPRPEAGKATLTIGLASAQTTGLAIKVNGKQVAEVKPPKSGPAGYRSGGQDSHYQVEYVEFDGSLLHAGANQITLGLRHAMPFSAPIEQRGKFFGEVMYDAIRLEMQP
jgi:rhamnogalacturonan endolyase